MVEDNVVEDADPSALIQMNVTRSSPDPVVVVGIIMCGWQIWLNRENILSVPETHQGPGTRDFHS